MWVALVAGLAAFAVALPRASAGLEGGSACPTFEVLHNDRIGSVVLPAGTYNIKGLRGGLTCQKAAQLFARFLQDYDGVLPHNWRAVQKGKGKVLFQRPGKRFNVATTGGGGAGGGARLGHLCPGNFRVLHNDHIGPLFFPAGVYQIYIPSNSVLPCQKASDLFSHFLSLPSGQLPGKWRLKRERAVFFKANQPKARKFRVDPGT